MDIRGRNNSLWIMKTFSEVAKEAMELGPRQRRTLARILLELSDEDNDFSLEAESVWEEEIVRRMEAVKAGTASARSEEDVFADLDRRFPS
jgi:hypothetical protein